MDEGQPAGWERCRAASEAPWHRRDLPLGLRDEVVAIENSVEHLSTLLIAVG